MENSKIDRFKGKERDGNFSVNPQNINRTGLNRKTFASINKALEAKGVTPVNKSEYIRTLGNLINLNIADLKELTSDKAVPVWMLALIDMLQDNKQRALLISSNRDYLYGSAAQKVDVGLNDGANIVISFKGLSGKRKLKEC